MTSTREPLIIATLNDGIEPQFPGTDIPRLSQYAQVIIGQELDRRLSDQLPTWNYVQGEANSFDSDIGIAIKPGLMTISDWAWVPTSGKRSALCVHADYLGAPLSLISAHRPTKNFADLRWPKFNANLATLVKAERLAGRLPIVGIDTNAANPTDLSDKVGLNWWAPYPDSIVGFLVPDRITQIGITTLSRTGEHPPVLAMIKVPVTVTI